MPENATPAEGFAIPALPVMYTREDVLAALNWAADEAQSITSPNGTESSGTIETDDTINLVVNLAVQRLQGAQTAADAVAEAYGGDDIQLWHGWVVPGWADDSEERDEDEA